MSSTNYLDSYQKYHTHFINPIVKEIILEEESETLTLLPIKYPDIFNDCYKFQLGLFWVAEDIKFEGEKENYQKLDTNTKRFISYVIAFFNSFDSIVNINMKENIFKYIKIKEAECAYSVQFLIENVHSEVYSNLLETYAANENEKIMLIESVTTVPSITGLADWCFEWIKSDKTFAHKIVAFAIVEGVFFSAAFACIFWLKSRKEINLPALFYSNDLISRDENNHVHLATMIYFHLKNKLTREVIYEIVNKAVEAEAKFVMEALPLDLMGMNAKIMIQYVKYVADRIIYQLGYPILYHVTNPFAFMTMIDSGQKVDFFFSRNSYVSGKVGTGNIILTDPDSHDF